MHRLRAARRLPTARRPDFGGLIVVSVAAMLLFAACSSGEGDGEGDASAATSPPGRVSPATDSDPVPPSDPAGLQPGGCDALEPGPATFATEAGGVSVDVRVLIPTSFDGSPLPAVLDWHGLGSDGTQQRVLTAYDGLAEQEGFVAVHPTAPSTVGLRSWELSQFDISGRDDLAVFDAIVDRLVTEHCVDPSRVFSTGMSNGGFFTARLICERAERIAAAVSVAGVSHPDDCRPSRPVPYLAFHGTADDVVPYEGGRSALQVGPRSDESEAFFDQTMPGEFAEFAADFGCRPEPEAVTVGDEVTRFDYLDCDDDVTVSFYEVEGGGHTWPGSPLGPLVELVLGRTTEEVSATAEGWALFSRSSIPS